jgi:hypothetical protein
MLACGSLGEKTERTSSASNGRGMSYWVQDGWLRGGVLVWVDEEGAPSPEAKKEKRRPEPIFCTI